MTGYRVVAALLWVLLALLGLFIVATLTSDVSATERVVSPLVVLLLAAPLVMQLRTLRSRMRQIGANVIAIDAAGVRVRLVGDLRRSKGLPEFQDTYVPWSDLSAITCDRRSFSIARSSRSSIRSMWHDRDFSHTLFIPFTRECVAGAERSAREIAARAGRSGP